MNRASRRQNGRRTKTEYRIGTARSRSSGKIGRLTLRRIARDRHFCSECLSGKRASRTAAEILLVDDSRGEIRLMPEVFRAACCSAKPGSELNGPPALAFLLRENPTQSVPRPSLILLDLNLPGANGAELLTEFKRRVARALMRAASALVPTPGRLFSIPQRCREVRSGSCGSLDTARMSACATSCANDFSATGH
jgi:CheY-like chemotaxis protein